MLLLHLTPTGQLGLLHLAVLGFQGTPSEQALLTSVFKWLLEVFANTPFAKASHMGNSVSHDREKESGTEQSRVHSGTERLLQPFCNLSQL